MSNITSSITIKRKGNDEVTGLVVTTLATAVSADTFTVTLSDYGISPTGFLGIDGMVHTTANSVIVKEVGTTSVTAGVLTVTVGVSSFPKDGKTLEDIISKSDRAMYYGKQIGRNKSVVFREDDSTNKTTDDEVNEKIICKINTSPR